MTGKTRIDGYTREQIIWLTLSRARAPMNQAQLRAAIPDIGRNGLCHALTRMFNDGRVQRIYGEHRYRYRAIGDMPADNRSPDTRTLRRNTPFGVDDPVNRKDNRDRGISPPGEIPAIPTLADLFARR